MRQIAPWCAALLLVSASQVAAQASRGTTTSSAAPAAKAPTPASIASRVDHASFDALLRAHVRDGLVDYEAFAKAPTFARYLASLRDVNVAALPEAERLAFWINAYNAFTIQLIVKHGEKESIRNINRSLGVLRLKGPWNEPLVQAGGRVLTLDQVFHRILRKEFRDPRMHFAVVPAALGGPLLRSEAFTGDRLDAQLDDQMQRFLSDTTRNWYRNGVLGLNAVFLAYERDFAATRGELVEYVAPYITLREKEPQRERLVSGRPNVYHREYDWTLNSPAGAQRAATRRAAEQAAAERSALRRTPPALRDSMRKDSARTDSGRTALPTKR